MDNSKKIRAVSFGEVLWDVFADGKKIGGAPLNLALRMQSLGCQGAIISAIGKDADGEDIIKYVQEKGLDTSGIVVAEGYPTGLVQVHLDERGSASYEISYPSAWDKIVLTQNLLDLVEEADVLIYGSLASRDSVSKESLLKLLQSGAYKVFDVNLRPPHYNIDTLVELMKKADFIKFNDEELLEIAGKLGCKAADLEGNMAFIAKEAGAKAICVTRGKHGAILLWDDQGYSNNGYVVKVADTVGAGDSFLATLIMKLLVKETPQKALDYACAMGALVAASPGANPDISAEQIEALISNVN
jgi:fructokinase